MKKILLAIVSILYFAPSALANYVLSFDAVQIINGNYPSLQVWGGSGLTLNFNQLKNESVKSLWLDDPSKLTIDYAGELCSAPCRGGVSVVHLKKVTGLNFENLPATARTTLTVVTVSPTGDKIYKFFLGYGLGKPKYLAVNVTPPISKQPLFPLLDRQTIERVNQTRPRPKTYFELVEANNLDKQIDTERINLIKKGLTSARKKLKPTENNKMLFARFEVFISQLESGKYSEEQARKNNQISQGAIELVVNLATDTDKQKSLLAEKTITNENEPRINSNVKTSIINDNDRSIDNQPIKERQNTITITNTNNQNPLKTQTVVTESVNENLTTIEEKLERFGIERLSSQQQANLISTGLLVAQNKKQINYRTRTYYKVQSAIKSLRKGQSLASASNRAKINLSILHQLMVWGIKQPVNRNAHQPITITNQK